MPRNNRLHTKVKTAKGRKLSSKKWLERQLNDPYVQKSQQAGYRSRATFKLIEIDEKFQLIKSNMKIIDLGAAPGGWSEWLSEHKNANVCAVDLLAMQPITNGIIIEDDFREEQTKKAILDWCDGGKANGVISDMAPDTTGHKSTDHLRIIALCEEAFYFACEVLRTDGFFLCKVFQGGASTDLLNEVRKKFSYVKHFKPSSSRKDSSEVFLVAWGFVG